MILAVIPARGGSKRLPGKNIAIFGGRPLLSWSIALARMLDNVHCVVSTEDGAIAAAARNCGAVVVDRPPALATEESAITDVMIHAAEAARAEGMAFEAIMLLQTTNPLRPLAMVQQAIARFGAQPCDSLITVSRRQLKTGRVADGVFMPNYAANTQSRTSPPTFYENGLLYLIKTGTLLDQRSIYGNRVLAFETSRPFDDVDIDEPVDLLVGEAILAAVRDRLGY
jgi:N-acylneuraminate cytidylyltransferase